MTATSTHSQPALSGHGEVASGRTGRLGMECFRALDSMLLFLSSFFPFFLVFTLIPISLQAYTMRSQRGPDPHANTKEYGAYNAA